MTNQEKLELLKENLRKYKVRFWEDVCVKNTDLSIPLYLPKSRIAVRIGDDDAWYKAVRNVVHPVIIRDSDDVSFVIEKVNNTIRKHQRLVARSIALDTEPLSSTVRCRVAKIRRRRKFFVASLVPSNTEATSKTSQSPTEQPRKKRPRITAKKVF